MSSTPYVRRVYVFLFLALSGCSVIAQESIPPEDISTLSLEFVGPSSQSQISISGSLSFTGMDNEVVGLSADMAFQGMASPEINLAGTLAYVGMSYTADSIIGRVEFAGIESSKTIPSGVLSYLGWQNNHSPRKGGLSFRGINDTDEITGALSFRGCLQEDELSEITSELPPVFFNSSDDANISLEGNYQITWSNTEHAFAYGTLTKGGQYLPISADDGYRLFGFSRSSEAQWALELWFSPPHTISQSSSYADSIQITSSSKVEIDYNYGILGYWGGSSVLSVGDEGLTGEWSYQDEQGQESWFKVESLLSGVTTSDLNARVMPVGDPVTVTTPYRGEVYSARGNREEVVLYLLGDNMWGRHYIWIPRSSGLELGSHYPICELPDESVAASGVERCSTPGQVIGQKVSLNVWPEARTGPQVIFFDEAEVSFDLVVTDEPSSELNCIND